MLKGFKNHDVFIVETEVSTCAAHEHYLILLSITIYIIAIQSPHTIPSTQTLNCFVMEPFCYSIPHPNHMLQAFDLATFKALLAFKFRRHFYAPQFNY